MAELSGNSCNIITILPLGLDCDAINASTPESSNGVLTLYITGGTPPYNVSWSNGEQGTLLYNLIPGEYTATVVDYYGDFTATTTCSVGYTDFYLEKFESCTNSSNLIYYVANLPSTFINDSVYTIQGQDGCWISKGIELTTGQTYVNTFAVVTSGPFNLCDDCVEPTPEPHIYPSDLCVLKTGNPNDYIQFYSGSTINGYPSWTSSTTPFILYYNSGTTQWNISGWTYFGNVVQNDTTNSPLGSWTVYGSNYQVTVTSGTCVNLPTISLSVQNSQCQNSNNGSVNITGSNGVPPYYYSLDGINYQIFNFFNGLTTGNYTAYIKDSNTPQSVTSQPFVVSNVGAYNLHQASLYLSPTPTITFNSVTKQTIATYNWYFEVSPPLANTQSITATLIHNFSASTTDSLNYNLSATPTLTYTSITGTTGGGQILSVLTSPTITSSTSNIGGCVGTTTNTTAYTKNYNIRITGNGQITGTISKIIETPDATLDGCPVEGTISDTIGAVNVREVGFNPCFDISPEVTNIDMTITRIGLIVTKI